MDNLLSGLGSLGLKHLETMELFSEEEKTAAPKQSAAKKEEKKAPEFHEEDILFDKTYVCPVCDKKVMVRTIRTGKLRLVATDMDLRPKYEPIESLKYDVASCGVCGFTALTRYFVPMAPSQKKAIIANICNNFQGMEEKTVYSYEDALERYKLALANAIVKNAKASEKAFICLKAGWLIRSWRESLDGSKPEDAEKIPQLQAQEDAFLKNALDGFIAARAGEGYPMCGMNETTLDYLLAAMFVRQEKYSEAAKLVGEILTSQTATTRLKDKARDLKEVIVAEMKKKNK